MVTAVLLMGGTGGRFGSSQPKQFHRLAGKKVYLYTLETFLHSQLFTNIILVCPEPWISLVKEDISKYPAVISIVIGGATRQQSSLKGLLACNPKTQIVVIHDAVRPFISNEILIKNVEAAKISGAADTCIPSADTLVYAPHADQIASIPLRHQYLRGQTPQSFAYPLILNAHLKAQEEGICNSSDDCSLLIRQNHPISVVRGSEENIKITTELDLLLAEQILRLRSISTPLLPLLPCLEGKKIAVTGGSGGIGSAICRQLQQEGAIPLILSRSAKDYPVDLTCYESTQRVFNRIEETLGPLDGLINSLGLLIHKPLSALSAEEIDLLIATNLTAFIYACKCAPLKHNAQVINIASSSYARGRKNTAVYSSTKAAIVNFSQGFAEEREDLRVNVLVPQRTHTSLRTHNFPGENPSTLLDPDEIAQEVVSLFKTPSMTGSLIEVRKKYAPHFAAQSFGC